MTGQRQVRRMPLGAFILGLLVLPLAAAGAQSPLTFDWDADLGTVNTLGNFGPGPSVDMEDSASVSFELEHGLGRGIMSYRLGGQIQYAPQRISAGAPTLSALTAYPLETGVSYELPPAPLLGFWLRAALGRLGLEEPTGLLLSNPMAVHESQLVDGFIVELRFSGFYGSLGAGYLGLLDRRVNRVRFTPQDLSEYADPSHYLAPPRGLAVLRLEAENLFAGQSFGLFGIGQKDLRDAPPTFDSWYAGAVVRGPISSGFRHASGLVMAVAVPSSAETGLALLLSSELAYRLPGNLLHEAWFSLLWASSAGGGLAAFPQLAGPPAGTDFAEALTDIVRIELGIDAALAIPPAIDPLRLAFTSRLLLRPGGQLPAGYSFTMAGPYVGTELELSTRFEPLLGLRFDLRAGTLITYSGILPYGRFEARVVL
jgi:hypothetical protein